MLKVSISLFIIVAVLSLTTEGWKKPLVQDEVGDLDLLAPKSDSNVDDYDNFNSKPLANKNINALKAVHFTTIRSTMATRPALRTTTQMTLLNPGISNSRMPQSNNIIIPPRPMPRAGKFYEHYPYNWLPRAYQLRPDLHYVYPKEYQRITYAYPYDQLPYSLMTWHQKAQQQTAEYNQYYNQYYGQQYGSSGSSSNQLSNEPRQTGTPKFHDNFENEDFNKLAAEAAAEKEGGDKKEETKATAKPSEALEEFLKKYRQV
uniref:Uncharacterized protein n=1 Tax=Rhabditophanes sp. KR3021 TaxID=114890 RepID=A0AC35U1H3_9BILA